MAIRKISFFDSFLSCGWVGTNFRSSANAPVTLCWRQRSRELVTVHGFRESGCTGNRRTPAVVEWLPDSGSVSSPDVRSSDVRSHSSSDPNSATTRDEDESSLVSLDVCCVWWFFGILVKLKRGACLKTHRIIFLSNYCRFFWATHKTQLLSIK